MIIGVLAICRKIQTIYMVFEIRVLEFQIWNAKANLKLCEILF